MYTAWENTEISYKKRLVSLYICRRFNWLLLLSVFYMLIMFVIVVITKYFFSETCSDTKYPLLTMISRTIIVLYSVLYLYRKIRISDCEMDFCIHYLNGFYSNFKGTMSEEEERDIQHFETYIINEYDLRFGTYQKALIDYEERRR